MDGQKNETTLIENRSKRRTHLLAVGGVESLGLLSVGRRAPVRGRRGAAAAALLLRGRRHDLRDAEVQVVVRSVPFGCNEQVSIFRANPRGGETTLWCSSNQ